MKDGPYTSPRLRNDPKHRCSWGKRRPQRGSGPSRWLEVADESWRAPSAVFQLPPLASSAHEQSSGQQQQEEGASTLS